MHFLPETLGVNEVLVCTISSQCTVTTESIPVFLEACVGGSSLASQHSVNNSIHAECFFFPPSNRERDVSQNIQNFLLHASHL